MKRIEEESQTRAPATEYSTKCLVVALDALPEACHLTFTVNDSFRSYKHRLIRDGLPCDFIIDELTDLPEYGKIFPISELRGIQRKYAHVESLKCEVQLWDPTRCTTYLEHNLAKNSDACRMYP